MRVFRCCAWFIYVSFLLSTIRYWHDDGVMDINDFNFSFPLLCGLIIAICNYLADILKELRKNNQTPSKSEIKYNYCREVLESWIEIFAISLFGEEENQNQIKKLKIAMSYLSIWVPCLIGFFISLDDEIKFIYLGLIGLSIIHAIVKSICHFKTEKTKD